MRQEAAGENNDLPIFRITLFTVLLISDASRAKIGSKHKMKESEIFTIKIPASPYQYKPGLGHVSESNIGRADILSALQGLQRSKAKHQQSKIIKIPTKFLVNGKLSLKSDSNNIDGDEAVTSSTLSTTTGVTGDSVETTTPTSQPVVDIPETTDQPPQPSTTQTVLQIANPLLYHHQPVLVPASSLLLRYRRPTTYYTYTSFHPPPPPTLSFNPFQVVWGPLHNYFYG